MSKGSIFYVVSLLTILGIRLGVFLYPAGKVRIAGVPIHHFWMGVALIIVALLISRRKRIAKLLLFSFGFAGFADELAFMLRGDGPLKNYWSPLSISGVVAIMVAVFFVRNKLVREVMEETVPLFRRTSFQSRRQ